MRLCSSNRTQNLHAPSNVNRRPLNFQPFQLGGKPTTTPFLRITFVCASRRFFSIGRSQADAVPALGFRFIGRLSTVLLWFRSNKLENERSRNWRESGSTLWPTATTQFRTTGHVSSTRLRVFQESKQVLRYSREEGKNDDDDARKCVKFLIFENFNRDKRWA